MIHIYRLSGALVLGLIVAAIGCGPPSVSGRPSIITLSSLDAPYELFPNPRGASGDPSACAAAVDSAIPYQRVVTSSRYLGALSLRLPAVYVAQPPVAGLPRSETMGGMLVASWRGPADISGPATSAERMRRTRGVTFWVVPESGLPLVGADPHTKQLSFVECPRVGITHRARLALFRLAMNADTTAYLAAVWPLSNGRYVQVLASAREVAGLAPVQRALLDAHTEPSQ